MSFRRKPESIQHLRAVGDLQVNPAAFGLLAHPALFFAVLPIFAVAYGLMWAYAATETPGMRWTHLRLTTFDGFPPDAKQRILRFAGSCLSLCTVVGLLWSLADEESLNWQDHISRTFPTPHIFESQILQRR